MKKQTGTYIVLAVILFICSPVIQGADSEFQGMSYTSWVSDAYASDDSRSSLNNMRDTNINYVAVIPTWYMEDGTSNTIQFDNDKTPTDSAINQVIDYIHNRGMKVMLKPHVDSYDDTWRGNINPSNVSAWFESYTEFMEHYAEIARDKGVEMFSVGCELKSLSGAAHSDRWGDVIDSIEAIYSGPLTYAANWDEYEDVSFWNRVDYAGIDAYFTLSDKQDPTLTELKEGWETHYDAIESWQSTINRPVIFTEIGYRSIDYAAQDPHAWGDPGVYNGELQARCYEAAITFWRDKEVDWFRGMLWWDWRVNPDYGGVGDDDFTPQNKPAQDVLKNLYSGIEQESEEEEAEEPVRVIKRRTQMKILPPSQNPFYAGESDPVAIRYELKHNARVRIRIYDLNMRFVATVTSGSGGWERKNAGTQASDWDGRDEYGKRVSSGIYIYQVESESYYGTQNIGFERELGKIMVVR